MALPFFISIEWPFWMPVESVAPPNEEVDAADHAFTDEAAAIATTQRDRNRVYIFEE